MSYFGGGKTIKKRHEPKFMPKTATRVNKLEQSKERFKERVAISVALISPMERSIISCKSSDKLVYFFIERISFFEGVLYFFSAGGAFFF